MMAGSDSYVDAKTAGKLEKFSRAPERWSEWSFKARAWFVLIDIGHGAVDAKMDDAKKMTEAFDSPALRRRLRRQRAGLSATCSRRSAAGRL